MRNLSSHRCTALLAGAALLLCSPFALAGHVDWSVNVGIPLAQPLYVQPAAVYVQPAPVYIQPQAVYVQPRTVVMAPVLQSYPVVQYQGFVGQHHEHHGHRHGHHDGHHGRGHHNGGHRD